MGKTCQICGKPSGMYPLCYTHLQMKNEGKVIKCENCGKWHFKDEPCGCKTTIEAEENSKHDIQLGKCIICNKETKDKNLFCPECYYKNKDKSLLIKITSCKEIEVLDESYEGIYVCKDGHVVKSKSEREIDNYFFENKIAHAYEKTLYIEGVDLHPDFYLPEKNLYLEHWGYNEDNIEYTKSKKFKLEKYKKAGITLICTYEKTDTKDIEAVLDRKLKTYVEGQINFLDEKDKI